MKLWGASRGVWVCDVFDGGNWGQVGGGGGRRREEGVESNLTRVIADRKGGKRVGPESFRR